MLQSLKNLIHTFGKLNIDLKVVIRARCKVQLISANFSRYDWSWGAAYKTLFWRAVFCHGFFLCVKVYQFGFYLFVYLSIYFFTIFPNLGFDLHQPLGIKGKKGKDRRVKALCFMLFISMFLSPQLTWLPI